ncbi:type IV secretory system conjugative DNA transfer family protein [Bacteroides sp. 51]|uniref:type IV secretory system conjugative DNA transfer family protein n=1 Tax=Bacteroides sp. 51 TaxID=2302938 RepID=UPI0013D0B289|nr:type IV secretory system conjugative DNA transfer family protein [Bacteroides sp. 51]NDV83422.1 type IV secretory system conjugative DNA transfer family protein [Bacteroides sp. 51]
MISTWNISPSPTLNMIVIESLVMISAFICLLCIRPFGVRWKNVCTYLVLSYMGTMVIIKIFRRYLDVDPSESLFIPYFLFFVISIYVYGQGRSKTKPQKDKDVFTLLTENGDIKFYNPFENFLVLGGAGSGKTKSVGWPILAEYMRCGFAGFIYDFKDFDYTKVAYTLKEKLKYPYPLYIINFTDMDRTHRFNILDKAVINNETFLFQVLEDFLKSMQPADAKADEWFNGALGILRGVAYRFYSFKGKYEKFCTLPHVLNFILQASRDELTTFLETDMKAKGLAGAFIGGKESERTAASYMSTLNNYINVLANNANVCWVLTGDDFKFNLIDPKAPKLFAVSNNFSTTDLISPIVAMLVPIAAKRIEFGNEVKFFFALDEMTTFKIKGFEAMPSTLREYNVSHLILTQAMSKLVKLYGKEDTSSIAANCANLFLGRTKDIESLKSYPLFFGKAEKEKKSYSSGSSNGGNNRNSNVTVSQQREEVYDSNAFADLRVGEFILSPGSANIEKIKTLFKQYKIKAKDIPKFSLTAQIEVNKNYDQILLDCDQILKEMCGR